MAHKEKKGLGGVLSRSGVPLSGVAPGVALAVLAALLETVPVFAVFFALSALAGLPLPAWFPASASALAVCAAAAAVGVAGSLLLSFASSMLCHKFAFRAICSVRISLVEHIKRLPISYFKKNASGKLVQVVQTDVDQLEGFIAHQLPDFASTVALLALLVASMVSFDALLALAAMAVLAVGFLGQFVPMVKLLKSGAMKENFDALERISSAATEYVHGMPSIKMFGQTPKSFAGFQDDIEAYRDFTSGMSRQVGVGVTFFRSVVISVATFLAPLVVAIFSADPASPDLAATALFFLVFAPAAAMPVCKLRSFSEGMNLLSESVSRIAAAFEEEPHRAAGSREPQGFSVEFDHASFAYGDSPVLSDVSFTAREGELTAVVGPSGSGKSTAAQLVCGFWIPTEGQVRIGGESVASFSEGELSSLVSFVFQESHVFSMSVADNIRLARPEASDEEVAQAACAARCTSFIKALPDGMDTVIGDGSVGLSGGERQRIAIARAFLKNAPILVLDEPTSAMDADTEREVQMALASLAEGRTVIMVAHRLSTVVGAGNIIVLDGGKVVQQGTHEELLSENGMYRRLWEASVESASWDAGR